MGNLLVAPITEKETHRGTTECGLEHGVSSMQGWRVHMEDAHIAEDVLYAEELICDDIQQSNNGGAVKRAKMNQEKSDTSADAGTPPVTDTDDATQCNRIKVPGHSLFAVFDGHGGTFAAEYAGLNFTRVLSRQPAFIQYANFIRESEESNTNANKDQAAATSGSTEENALYERTCMEHLEKALRDAFLDIDREIWRAVSGIGNVHSILPPRKGDDLDNPDNEETIAMNNNTNWNSGTTAVVVMFTPQKIICANAGDSRSIYSKQGNCTIPLSYDHKPDDEEEERRIYAAGGHVRGGRVEGDLAVSRGLGDFRFKEEHLYQSMGTGPISFSDYARNKKGGEGAEQETEKELLVYSPSEQKVSPMPDIIVQNRSVEHDEFVIVACDGIFDVATNHECIAMTAEILNEGERDLGLVCEEILDMCLEKGSKDNMTALVIKMPAQTIGQGGGVEERRRIRQQAAEGGAQA